MTGSEHARPAREGLRHRGRRGGCAGRAGRGCGAAQSEVRRRHRRADFSTPAPHADIAAPEPPRLTEAEAFEKFGPDFVYYATRLRGAANDKAKQQLGFAPRPLEWLASRAAG